MGSTRGFTILELLMTLVVISVLAAITIPTYFGEPDVTLENAAILLARDLRTAQNRSAYMAEECDFIFTDDGDGYRVHGPRGQVIINPTTALDFVRRYSEDAVFGGVRIRSVECGGDRTLRFTARGQITEAARLTLEFGGSTRVLVVEKGNGRVAILGSSSNWIDNGY